MTPNTRSRHSHKLPYSHLPYEPEGDALDFRKARSVAAKASRERKTGGGGGADDDSLRDEKEALLLACEPPLKEYHGFIVVNKDTGVKEIEKAKESFQ